MYKIIGADGKEYGPINLDQLKQWIAEGRLNLQSKVLPDGATEWKTVGELPELGRTSPAGPAPLPPPNFSYGQPDAAQLVRGPAIFILVLAILNILASILSLFWRTFASQIMAQFTDMPPETLELQRKLSLFFGIPANLLGLLLAITCLIGALQMMKLKSYGFAMATAIIMLIPCGGCCCLLNIGAGIWALIVLNKAEVKAAFQ